MLPFVLPQVPPNLWTFTSSLLTMVGLGRFELPTPCPPVGSRHHPRPASMILTCWSEAVSILSDRRRAPLDIPSSHASVLPPVLPRGLS